MSGIHTYVTGRVGRDPEMQYTPNGNAIVSISIAVDNPYKAGDEWKKGTIWVRATFFNKPAETINEYVRKGSMISLAGKLKVENETGEPRVWTDKEGKNRATVEMIVTDYTLIGSKKTEESAGE